MTDNWREHPKLLGRLDPAHADDLQVLVHDGGPRMMDRRPELVWVRVSDVDGDVFVGEVLNEPVQLTTVREGMTIQFVIPDSGKYPLQVRPKYLKERGDWIIHPCNHGGLSELFDAPSDLTAVESSATHRARDAIGAESAFAGRWRTPRYLRASGECLISLTSTLTRRVVPARC